MESCQKVDQLWGQRWKPIGVKVRRLFTIANGNGQEIVGAILLKSETIGSDGLAAEILALAKSHLKSHEVPARLVFIKHLPTVLGGAKVQRDVLQRQLLEAGS